MFFSNTKSGQMATLNKFIRRNRVKRFCCLGKSVKLDYNQGKGVRWEWDLRPFKASENAEQGAKRNAHSKPGNDNVVNSMKTETLLRNPVFNVKISF